MPKSKVASKIPLESNSIESIAKYIKDNNVKKIIVMSGAGISTAAGIPDFRSKKTGLYHNLQRFNLPYAEAVFDMSYFEDHPEPFYILAKELYPGKFYPTKTHYFVKLLDQKGVLLRNFTQNIDTLERMTGLSEDKIIEAHGSFASASCIFCHKVADPEFVREHALKGEVPRCKECDGGLIKPNITFFGESLPERFHASLDDFDEAELLVVIGTSLQVHPFAGLIDHVKISVPRLLINREPAGVHHSRRSGFDFEWEHGRKRDALYLGSCDEGIEKLAKLLGWEKDLEKLYVEGNKKLKQIWDAEQLGKDAEDKAKEEEEEIEKLGEVLENLTTKDKEEEEEEVKEKSKNVKEKNKESKESSSTKDDKEVEKLTEELSKLTAEDTAEDKKKKKDSKY
ncbi:NAD-dependent deacetylase sirtuin-2, partial [Backusella circina FSU 941]